MSLLLVLVFSAWSADASAQGNLAGLSGRTAVKKSRRLSHGVTVRRTSHITRLRTRTRIKRLASERSVSRTERTEVRRGSRAGSDKDGSLAAGTESSMDKTDMTAGYMTESFRRLKGHLPWPVDSKKVMTRFGFQAYELTPSVHVNNLGINIAVDKDSCVRVVSDGIVDDVMDIGDAKAIMVLHGKYFTIYSDLSTACVVKGQQVVAGDVLGQVGETGQVDFRIYDPYDVWQDPQKWLVREK